MITDAELSKILSKASDGLLFISEADYPFKVSILEQTKETDINMNSILKLVHGSPEDYIEEFDFDFLFSTPTLDQDWHSPEDSKTVARFRNLVATIKSNLADIKVFRRGKIHIDVYIAGRAPSGNIVIISTIQIQT
jgi:hypothetical protein